MSFSPWLCRQTPLFCSIKENCPRNRFLYANYTKAIKTTIAHNAKILRKVRQKPGRTMTDLQLTSVGFIWVFTQSQIHTIKSNATLHLTVLINFQHLSVSFCKPWWTRKMASTCPCRRWKPHSWCCSGIPGHTAVGKEILFLWEAIKSKP